MFYFHLPTTLFLALLLTLGTAQAAETTWQAGAAKVDITPTYPIMLSGYASRGLMEVSETIQPLYARALALEPQGQKPVVLLTVDNCGVPATVSDAVAAALEKRLGIPRDRLAICSTHTHYAPMLSGVLNNLASQPIPPEKQATIDRYTQELTNKLIEVAVAAIEKKKPATLALGLGEVGFAANRRTPGGPTDHQLPVLHVQSTDGETLAVVAGYACHCTTISQMPAFVGDWAGYAAEALERRFPGAVGLVVIGCGGDQNPNPRGKLEQSQEYGLALADEAARVLRGEMQPITAGIQTAFALEQLPFADIPTLAQWKEQAESTGIQGHYARRNVERLEQGEKLPQALTYPIQTWNFGNQLAIVFLGGEVVVDYSLRIKQEAKPRKVWVAAYTNDVRSYIPSERVLREGGYEGGGSRIWYDQPAVFAPGLEDIIVERVRRQLAESMAGER